MTSVRWLCALMLAQAAAAAAAPDLLPPEKAFRFSARAAGPQAVEARFTVADGYYLYRDKIRFRVEPAQAGLVAPVLPPGKVKRDEFFGEVETYRGVLRIDLTLDAAKPGQRIVIKAESQGCADAGICYPPTVQEVAVLLPAGSVVPGNFLEPEKKGWFN